MGRRHVIFIASAAHTVSIATRSKKRRAAEIAERMTRLGGPAALHLLSAFGSYRRAHRDPGHDSASGPGLTAAVAAT